MAEQIFISYSSKDVSKIKKLVDAVKSQHKDLEVWWDKKIPPGKQFDRAISEALDKSTCIIVVWSKNSVQSDWVMDEALEARERNIILPIMIGKTEIPFGYRRYQTIDFTSWKGSTKSSPVTKLVKGISAKVTDTPKSKKAKATTKAKKKQKPLSPRRLSGGMDGKTFVFTGKLAETRVAQAQKVMAVGATFNDSGVSKNTDFLVVGKKPGAKKLADAKRHGVKTLTEKQWLKMLNDTYKRILIGKKVAFAGTLDQPQATQAKLLKKFQASLANKVTAETNLLVVGQNPGQQKLKQAEKHRVQVIDEKLWNEILASLPQRKSIFDFFS